MADTCKAHFKRLHSTWEVFGVLFGLIHADINTLKRTVASMQLTSPKLSCDIAGIRVNRGQ
jgi:hypothetical protein